MDRKRRRWIGLLREPSYREGSARSDWDEKHRYDSQRFYLENPYYSEPRLYQRAILNENAELIDVVDSHYYFKWVICR